MGGVIYMELIPLGVGVILDSSFFVTAFMSGSFLPAPVWPAWVGGCVFGATCKQLGVLQSVFEATGNVRMYVMYQHSCVRSWDCFTSRGIPSQRDAVDKKLLCKDIVPRQCMSGFHACR